MTEHEIKFNYDNAMKQAEQLKTIGKGMSKLEDSMLDPCMDTVKKNWDGTNSDSYVKKGKKVQTKITTTSGDVTGIAGAIETMAKRIYDAEMTALEVARKRRYQNG